MDINICGQIFSDQMIQRIQETVYKEPGISRKALSLRVCEWLGWEDALGRAKQMSCRKALMKLHRQGHIGINSYAQNSQYSQ